jgi:precorrin-6Y C5,15-methyltransferase (decarboxylating)
MTERQLQAVNKIHVIGIGFRPLEKRASDAVLRSEAVLVNSRLLEVFKGYSEYEQVKDRILVHGSVYETLDYIVDNYRKKKIVLLAAGDPMFFGIGRLIIEKLGQDDVIVYPDLSSVQVAFSRVRETSNNALFISLHGGPDPAKRRKMEHEITEVPYLLQKHHKVAILTDKVNTPEKIAKEIQKASIACRGDVPSPSPSAIKIYVCEKIGYDDEKVTEGTAEEISQQTFQHPNVVIVTVGAGSSRPDACIPDYKFGLKESEIAHSRGLITKDEVRAVTIHKLRLPEQGVLWDIGAGSGSVSIEASRICPGLRIFAVEKKEEQIQHINGNKASFHATNIKTVKGEAPDILEDLPDPDRVIIGGSGGSLRDIVNAATVNITSGIIVINATTIETLNEAVQSLENTGMNVDVCEVSISRSKLVGQKKHMSALNPIFIITGEKPPC